MYDAMTAYFKRFGWDESQIKNTQQMRGFTAAPVSAKPLEAKVEKPKPKTWARRNRNSRAALAPLAM